MAPGTSGIKPNISTFGADQIDPTEATAAHSKESFCMYLYLTVNLGCVVAFGFLANVATGGLPLWFHKRMVSCSVALLVYTAKNTVPVVWPAVQCLLGGRHTTCGEVALMGWAFLPTLIILFVLQVFFPSHALTALSLLVGLLCIGCAPVRVTPKQLAIEWASHIQSPGVWTECQRSLLEM